MTKIGLRTFAVPTPQPLRQTNGRAQVRQILLGKSPFLVISPDGAGADFVIDRICTLRCGMGPVLGCGGVGPEPKAILVSQPLRRNKYGIVVALHPGTANTVLSRPFQRNVAPDRLFTPERAGLQLLNVIGKLKVAGSGVFLDCEGQQIGF